jgi:hypothetical protein
MTMMSAKGITKFAVAGLVGLAACGTVGDIPTGVQSASSAPFQAGEATTPHADPPHPEPQAPHDPPHPEPQAPHDPPHPEPQHADPPHPEPQHADPPHPEPQHGGTHS